MKYNYVNCDLCREEVKKTVTKIKDVTKRVYSGGTPDTRKSEYWNGSIKWLSSGETRNNFIYDTDKKITDLGVVNSSTKLANKNSIVMACAGQGFTRGQTSYLMDDMYINQSVICIEPDKDKVDGLYLYYFFKNSYHLLRKLSDDHSSRGSITTAMIKDLDVEFPDLEIQKKVSDILYSLDKKIDLNNEINNNLHELCNSIYFELLCQLDESNSSIKQLKEVSKCVLGGTPSRVKSEYWGGNINWINSGEVNKFRIIDGSETITDLGLKKSSTTLLPKGTTVLAITGATLGQVSRLEIDSCANQSVIGIIPNNIELNNYIYLSTLNTIKDLILKQTGGAQQHINKNDVETHEIIIPNDKLIKEFDERIKPIFNKISLICFENKNLILLRDRLLPKLMNGEIDLDNIEI
jgi:type I restriction enzyme S subunit